MVVPCMLAPSPACSLNHISSSTGIPLSRFLQTGYRSRSRALADQKVPRLRRRTAVGSNLAGSIAIPRTAGIGANPPFLRGRARTEVPSTGDLRKWCPSGNQEFCGLQPLLRSLHRRHPRDGNAGSTRSPPAEKVPRLLQPARVEIGLQQGELDQVVLRAAATNAFVFPGERRKRLDRRGKIAAFECLEAVRQRRQVGAGRVTLGPSQILDLAGAAVEPGLIANDGLRQDDMQVGDEA